MRTSQYSHQYIDEKDISSVIDVLKSDWLTTGPKVPEFEDAFANDVNAKYAVAVSSGTAALHTAMFALGISPGDEVIVPAMTFAATANSVVFQGGTPVFCDVDSDTLLIDPVKAARSVSPRTRAVIAVDYTGHPCDYESLEQVAEFNDITSVSDACHSLGGKYKGRKVGSLAKLNIFSFHPVKHITTGEGGMITTDDEALAKRMRIFRNHGINSSFQQRKQKASWFYEMTTLGFNYRITDFQCALGLSQLKKLPGLISRRQEIAKRYDEAFADSPHINGLGVNPEVSHAYHLYVVKLNLEGLTKDRTEIFRNLTRKGVRVNVHYIPVHLHPFYRMNFNTGPGLCPVAEEAYERIISLPLSHNMSDPDVEYIIKTVNRVVDSSGG